MEWYRKTTWTAEDETDFFTRLKRAREYNRPQYLRIQAYHLHETGDEALYLPAISLLEQMLEQKDYLGESLERSSALLQMGLLHQDLGDYEAALSYLQQSVDSAFGCNNSYLYHAALVVILGKSELYPDVETRLIDRVGDRFLFPVAKYKICCVLAIIYHRWGDLKKAWQYAAAAKHFEEEDDSGLRYHRKLGLVQQKHKTLQGLMDEIF